SAGRQAGRRRHASRHGRHGWYGRHGHGYVIARTRITFPSRNVRQSPAQAGLCFLGPDSRASRILLAGAGLLAIIRAPFEGATQSVLEFAIPAKLWASLDARPEAKS